MNTPRVPRILSVLSVAIFLCAPLRASQPLGIDGRFLDAAAIAELFNISIPAGVVLVQRVAEGSPAERAGLRGGSVSATIDGQEIVLGGDLIVQLEVHNVCTGECLTRVPNALEVVSWIGVTYLRRGKLERAVVDVADPVPDQSDPLDLQNSFDPRGPVFPSGALGTDPPGESESH